MKKILPLLTGIVFLFTILFAGGCSPSEVPPATEDLSVVRIYVKAVKINGENHLEMYDSNNTKRIIDDLYTDVTDGTEVYWVLTDDSGLKKIKRIRPKESNDHIMTKKAKGIFIFTGYKKHVVPVNQTPGDEEGYYIKVKDEDGKKWEIDPYLRIRGTDDSNPG